MHNKAEQKNNSIEQQGVSVSNSTDLLPCPFCNHDKPNLHNTFGASVICWRVTCFGCGASSQDMLTKEATTKLWNTRTG